MAETRYVPVALSQRMAPLLPWLAGLQLRVCMARGKS